MYPVSRKFTPIQSKGGGGGANDATGCLNVAPAFIFGVIIQSCKNTFMSGSFSVAASDPPDGDHPKVEAYIFLSSIKLDTLV